MNTLKSTRKLYKPLLLLTLFSLLSIGATKAYFTTSAASDENIFTSGNLSVAVTQDNVLAVQNWFPSDEHTLEFTLTNDGSMPVYAKGYLGGVWNQEELDPSVFDISKLERKVNETWVVVINEGLDIGEEFYLSSDGSVNSLLSLEPSESTQFRLTTKLSESTDDEYQNKIFTSSLHLAGRQTVDGAAWPDTY